MLMTQFYEYVKMALMNVLHNKVRSFLTMLGIIIGISSVILVIGLGNGAKNVITSAMSDIGEGQIAVYTTDYDNYKITQEDLDKIKEKVDGVKGVTVEDSTSGSTRTIKGEFTVNLNCVMPDYKYFMTQGIVSGRFFDQKEYDMGKTCCVISEDDAMRLFGSTDVVGAAFDVEVNGVNLKMKIIGVQSSESNTMISFSFGDMPVSIYVPETILRQVYGISVEDFYSALFVAESDADTYQVANEILETIKNNHKVGKNDEDVYQMENFSDYMKIVNTVINVITVVISMIASISLVVGGIGVMNIMLVSVTERTREIGIRKALGAKTKSIMAQFLAESVIITLIGGIIGILVGIGGANLIAGIASSISTSFSFKPAVSIQAVLIATLFSSVVGIFFGIYPARKAAKMNPIDALRR